MNRLTAAALAVAAAIGAVTVHARPAAAPFTAHTAAVADESLDGTWELVSLIDDGKVVPLDLVKETMIKDLRVVIKGPVAAVVRPDGKLRTLAFVTDAKAEPKTVDVAGVARVGGKGIYLRDRDTLMICTGGSDTAARPAMMASLPDSDTFLMTFRRVAAAAPAELPPPPPPPARPADEGPAARMLVGTWGHQTNEQIVKVTLNGDGTFSSVTSFKKGVKKVFDAEERTSGKWLLKDGTVTLTASASTERKKVGQVYSYQITSLTDSEVLYVDNQTGQRRIEWKLR